METANCGTRAGTNGKPAVAQLTVNVDCEKVEKPGQKHKNMHDTSRLEGASVECSYTNGYQVYSSPGRLSVSPSPSPHSSSQGGSGGGIIGSGSNIDTKSGGIHEFLSESKNDRLKRPTKMGQPAKFNFCQYFWLYGTCKREVC